MNHSTSLSYVSLCRACAVALTNDDWSGHDDSYHYLDAVNIHGNAELIEPDEPIEVYDYSGALTCFVCCEITYADHYSGRIATDR